MNRRWFACVALTAFGALAGCTAPGPAQEPLSGAPDPLTCTETDVEVARDEVTELGFSADQVLARLEGTYATQLQYRDAGTTDLTITVAQAEDPILLREWAPPPEDPDMECPGTSLIVRVAVTFTTADGAFAESWTQELQESVFPPSKTLYVDLPTADLHGDWDPGDATAVSFWVNVSGDGEAPTTEGELVSIVEAPDAMPTECGFASWNMDPLTACP